MIEKGKYLNNFMEIKEALDSFVDIVKDQYSQFVYHNMCIKL